MSGLGLTRGALVSQELPLALPLAPAGPIAGLSAVALVLVVEAARVDVPRALPDGEQVTGSLALVNAKLARGILNALPLLQKPTGWFLLGLPLWFSALAPRS